MESSIKFGSKESIALLVNLVCTKMFLNFPRSTIEIAGQASWILVIYISMIAFISLFILIKLYPLECNLDILDVTQKYFGAFGRIVLGLTILFFLVFSDSMVLREFCENMKTISLPTSPISFVTTIFVICMVIAAYLGIESLVRLHSVFVPIIVAGFAIIIIGILPELNFDNLFPLFGNGVNSIFLTGNSLISGYWEIMILFFIVPFVSDKKLMQKISFKSFGISALLLFLSSLMYSLCFSYPNAIENFLPIYEMARLINYGRYVQRIESVFLFSWSAAAFLYLSSLFFFSIYIFKKTFKLEYYKPIIMPFAILVFTLSLIPSSLMDVVLTEISFLNKYAGICLFGIVFLLLIFGKLLKKDRLLRGKNEF